MWDYLALAAPAVFCLGFLAWMISDNGLWLTIQLLGVCAAVAFLSAVLTLGVKAL